MFALSAAEVAFWEGFYRRHGFPADRAEAATAIAGSYLGGAWGGTARPADLLPRFGPRPKSDPRALLAYLTSIPGAVIRRGRQ